MDQSPDLFDYATTSSTPSRRSSTRSASNPPDLPTTRSSLIVAATGTGKTVMMAGLANHWPTGRVMMVSHRFELNQQACATFARFCGEDVDIEQAHLHADRYGARARIVVASVQTLNSRRRGRKRMEKFDPYDFGLVMVDEAHRAAASSYKRVFDYFGQNPECRFVGVTATPDRLDGAALGSRFQNVACNYDIGWGVANGWLVAPTQRFVQIDGLDLRRVKTTAGDLDSKQLAAVVEAEKNLHAMAAPIVDVAGDRQTIVFAASVKQAHRLAELIRDYWSRKNGRPCPSTLAVSMDGKLSPQDPTRQSLVRDFKAGEIQFFVNCGIATEGFDAPAVEVIAIGRPTKSRALYTQMVGRATRPLPGIVDIDGDADARRAAIAASDKPGCTILDFVGQSGRHSLVCTTDILGGREPAEVQERARAVAASGDFDGNTLDAIREAREQIAAEREARRRRLTVGVDYRLRDAATLYDLSQIPTSSARNYLAKRAPSDKQRAFLIKLGWTSIQVAKMNMKQASDAIEFAIANPRTPTGRWVARKKAEEARDGTH